MLHCMPPCLAAPQQLAYGSSPRPRPAVTPPVAVCCMAAFCSCCVSYHLRKRQLRGDMTRYIWCGRGLQQRLSWQRYCAASACLL